MWLTGTIDGEAAVKEMPVDGTVPPQLATGFIALAPGSEVVGRRRRRARARGRPVDPHQLVTWDPATRTTDFVARSATLVAAAEGSIAWIRNGCDECGIYVRRDGVIRVYQPGPERRSVCSGRLLAGRPIPRARDHRSLAGRRCRRRSPQRHRRRSRPAPRHSGRPPPWRPSRRRHAGHPLDCAGRDDVVLGWGAPRPRHLRSSRRL